MKINFNHHAYLIEGRSRSKSDLIENLRELGVKIKGNPDLFSVDEEKLSIEKARAINDFQSKKGLNNKRKIILILINSATREAQNALLKTLEEPTPNTHFFIIAPRRDIFLPTVQSRLEIIEEKTEKNEKEFSSFLKASLKKKMKKVEKIIKNKDRSSAEEFLDNVIRHFGEKKDFSKKEADFLNKIIELKKYLKDRAPSLKQILEYTVINFPQK